MGPSHNEQHQALFHGFWLYQVKTCCHLEVQPPGHGLKSFAQEREVLILRVKNVIFLARVCKLGWSTCHYSFPGGYCCT